MIAHMKLGKYILLNQYICPKNCPIVIWRSDFSGVTCYSSRYVCEESFRVQRMEKKALLLICLASIVVASLTIPNYYPYHVQVDKSDARQLENFLNARYQRDELSLKLNQLQVWGIRLQWRASVHFVHWFLSWALLLRHASSYFLINSSCCWFTLYSTF
jgi:hypothetical protein